MLRALSRLGFARGFGGSRAWLIVGTTATVLRVLARIAAREPEVVYSEELRPGQSLVISHLPPASKH